MFKLKNITVKEYLTSEDFLKYDEVLKHQKGKSDINILQKPYTDVKYCLSLLSKLSSFDNIAEVFEVLFDIPKDKLMAMGVLEYYNLRNYLISTFKTIIDNEKKVSQGGNTDEGKWFMAGGDRLKPYNDILPLDQLAQRYGGSPFDWGRKPYSEVFYLIVMTKTANEVSYNYTTMK